MSVENDIATLRARITAAQRARIRAEHERDSAQATADQALTQLTNEHGVSTLADARTKLTQLEEELAQKLETLNEQLDQAGV